MSDYKNRFSEVFKLRSETHSTYIIIILAGTWFFKVDNGNIGTKCEIFPNFLKTLKTIKTLNRFENLFLYF